MPTGYTAGILDGRVSTLNEFAKKCMREFGACIHMRDDDLDTEYVPAVASKHYLEFLENARKELDNLSKMSDKELIERRKEEIKDDILRNENSIIEGKKNREKLNLMLSKVNNWDIPNDNYIIFKKFMINQIEETIELDCDIEYNIEKIYRLKKELKKINPDEIRENYKEMFEHDIEYYTKRNDDEINRCKNANEWAETLLKSINNE